MWWKKKHNLPSHLQLSQGPYVPGCCDVFTDSCDVSKTDECFFRLYYPTKLNDDKDHSSQWVRWMAHPMYLRGMAKILQLWTWIVRLFYAVVAGDVHIPVVWAAPPLDEGPAMPVVVMSHGMGGARYIYSGTCIELASTGCVVVALEHRDTSACSTPKSLSSTRLAHMPDVTGWIKYTAIPKDKTKHAALRLTQVQQRANECLSAVAALDKINSGTFKSRVSFPLCLTDFKGRLDMTRLVMMGHSFGAATALLALGREQRFTAGVILDPWMYPLKDLKTSLPQQVTQPLVFINTETFQIDKNVSACHSYTRDHPVYTIRATTHEHQTDTVHIFGSWLNWGMQKLHPSTASQINNHLIMRFLRKQIGLEGGDERFLSEESDNIIPGFVVLPVKSKSS